MRIGIVGSGQLARMMAFAGRPMGIDFSFVAAEGEDTVCVDGLGKLGLWRGTETVSELYTQLGEPDCITVEKEQLDSNILKAFAPYCEVHPSIKAVEACQHRNREKTLLHKLGIPSARFTFNTPAVDSVRELGVPVVVKSCEDGYDGKNQWRIKSEKDAEEFDALGLSGDIITEQWINFDREVSQVSVRSRSGNIKHYPLAENVHDNGILSRSIAPAPEASEELQKQAQTYITKLLEELDYVGVLAMECFVVGDVLMVNELAPRVHNSGHWTQNGAATSQFANHIRALAGMPLGATDSYGVAGMLNLIGCQRPQPEAILDYAALHWYSKSVRPGRKLGHINVWANDYPSLEDRLQKLSDSLSKP
jgi:5-(carboxyamino)imidazole ribonucleotide synthase